MDDAKELAELLGARERLEASLKKNMERSRELQDKLLEAIEEGRFPQTCRVDGRSFYVKRRVFAGKNATDEQIVGALRRAGLEDYVRLGFNMNSISAYVRDVVKESSGTDYEMLSVEEMHALLPPDLKPYLKVSEKIELGHRPS